MRNKFSIMNSLSKASEEENKIFIQSLTKEQLFEGLMNDIKYVMRAAAKEGTLEAFKGMLEFLHDALEISWLHAREAERLFVHRQMRENLLHIYTKADAENKLDPELKARIKHVLFEQ